MGRFMYKTKIHPFSKNDDLSALAPLVGKKIVSIGYAEGVEGGLTIDYEAVKGLTFKRVIIGYTDLGSWIAWHGEVGVPNPEDLLKERIAAFVKAAEGYVYLKNKKVEIKDVPMERRYSFLVKGKEKLSLSISDLKMLPGNIRMHFLNVIPKDKNVEEIYCGLAIYANL
jgi:hypothetical protein